MSLVAAQQDRLLPRKAEQAHDPIPAIVRADIEHRLRRIEAEHDVRIVHAIESGSRAWGFASPDSDYDIRFLYVGNAKRYVRLFPPRDVIEAPIDGLIDLNGWDMQKSLRLLLKSNAVLSEWLESPIRYRFDAGKHQMLSAFADRALQVEGLRWHYLSMAEREWALAGYDATTILAKRYFYVLRPVLTLRFLRLHEGRPPMTIDALSAAANLPEDVVAALAQVRAVKISAAEQQSIDRNADLDALIVADIEQAKLATPPTRPVTADLIASAEALFANLVATS